MCLIFKLFIQPLKKKTRPTNWVGVAYTYSDPFILKKPDRNDSESLNLGSVFLKNY
jgi:hypothetical protein